MPPFSLALKQPRTAVTLEAAAWSPAWTGRGSLSPQCILLPWQVNPISASHAEGSSFVEAVGF